MKRGSPIVLVGSYAKSHPLTRYLASIYPVVVVDEYMTSQTCPKCFCKLKQTTDIRHYACSNPDCKRTDGGGRFEVNKDISASFDICWIFIHILLYGTRPQPFTRL